ncbi:cell surface glycoprotein [Streptomyces echinoruber]|uniref:DNA-binding phage zinc finger domain-containing protein n=1 Tax=Streptomyces echinoruber TaxID=68898 RepID=A0A918VSV4_9ACTN|nr:cell surface glycoprotein [Streptomyces echinoruber]GHA19745.1 hypothetical protein GCM10010389_66510 [Streptomyces echinoruber]
MDRRQIAALLAHADRLDPTRAPADRAAAAERLDQWHALLADVPATAPHPEGRHFDAADVVRHHIATSPYPIKPSDVSRVWADFRRDVLSRHVDPVPDVDPDDDAAYRAALAAQRRAIETGQAVAQPRAALTAGRDARNAQARDRLRALGVDYVPKHVRDQLAPFRPVRAMRERLAAADLPDPLDVECTWCGATVGKPCRVRRINPKTDAIGTRRMKAPHPCRVEAAQARRAQQGAVA